jgi:hypothetical protein
MESAPGMGKIKSFVKYFNSVTFSAVLCYVAMSCILCRVISRAGSNLNLFGTKRLGCC